MAIWSIAASYASLRVFTDRIFVLFRTCLRPRTPPLFSWQTGNLSNIPNILWICFPVFALWDLERLGSIIFLTLLKTLFLGIIHRLFLKTLKTTYFSTCVPKFLFRGSQIFCLLTFKIRPSLGLSCLMLPMLKILSN